MKPAATITMDEWRAALDAVARAKDAEGETSESIAARYGWCVEHARVRLNRLVRAGRAEHVGYKKSGHARLKVYRLVGGKAKGKK